MHELANRVVGVDDILPRRERDLPARLAEAPSSEARFALLDEILATRLAEARPPSPEVVWAWRALVHTNGRVPIGILAKKLGRSRRHLIARFRDQIGLPPKTVARILRFDRVVELLQSRTETGFAELAQECGYFDQAHLTRDFRAFAGTTPGEFVRRLVPNGGVRGG
jgi:AraC-like DNA-binding protein